MAFEQLLSNIYGIPLWAIILLSIWQLIWDGFALWKAVTKRSKIWFIVLLITNTFGILEILYLFLFSEFNSKKSKKKK